MAHHIILAAAASTVPPCSSQPGCSPGKVQGAAPAVTISTTASVRAGKERAACEHDGTEVGMHFSGCIKGSSDLKGIRLPLSLEERNVTLYLCHLELQLPL